MSEHAEDLKDQWVQKAVDRGAETEKLTVERVEETVDRGAER